MKEFNVKMWTDKPIDHIEADTELWKSNLGNSKDFVPTFIAKYQKLKGLVK